MNKIDTKNEPTPPPMDAMVGLDLLEQASDGVVIIDDKNRIVFFNSAAEALWGYAKHEVLGRNVSCLVPSIYRQQHDGYIDANRKTGINKIVGTSREVTFESKSGDYISGEMSISTALIGPEKKRYYMAFMKGVTEEGHRKRLLDLQKSVFDALSGETVIQDVADMICQEVEGFVPNTVAVLMLLGEDGHLQILSGPGLPRRFALALERMDLTPADLQALDQDPTEAMSIVWESYHALGVSLGLYSCWALGIRNRKGRTLGIFALYSRNQHKLSNWPQKIVEGCVPFCGLVIEQHEARQHISQLSNYDPLTGFLNRSVAHRMIKTMISLPNDAQFAIYMIDIDRFRDINDALGHVNGDAFLKTVAERLKSLSRSNYILSRSGANEFIVIVPNISGPAVMELARKIMNTMREPINISGNQIVGTVCIGISQFPEHGPDGESLLSYAEQAMRNAKKQGPGTFRVASNEDNKAAQDRLVLGLALRESIADGLLTLYYQPQVKTSTGELYGVEALSRWNHPTLGNIYPSRFIAVAEETGQIEAIGKWSLEQAMRQITQWDRAGVHVPTVSVNLSAGHFRDRSLPGYLSNLLSEYSVPAHRLTVEITESIMMEKNGDTLGVLDKIRNLGIGLSMDDFGTGYSSLSRLMRLPLTEIKIDRSFIMNLDHDANAQAVTTAVVGIGSRLGMAVVTEGVETEQQYEMLKALNCDVMQGYLFARPMPPEEVEKWVHAREAK
ncbi:EAL domain-containing protein [Novacetimonas pomaceti]|uniref:C-di-GMP phosphodiesterase n=1 Tax=Novacetimonas pomaceti TaxID=2021998 RepID=A0A318QTF0_9PROT|nr:EAL domain-containing protein [Novacetimonas pomaceti]MBV1835207.1 EAL domain-containing protein [Novacetimonas pomaceti]PYD47394.1 c-di-GMP phosphodiesterase [Novacetimonas pomaceti]PYD76013.1 c-di-GMP phosphodiesterase [Novacetimonas pomaceti]